MSKTHLSFYLKANRIHIFVDALRLIGSPANICSHRVSAEVYKGKRSMEISSLRLCRIMAEMQQWNTSCSYRVPGVIMPRQQICVFYLDQAEPIKPV